MIIHDFRAQFYDVVQQAHTLVIVSADVDALCAAFILSHALTCDDATFTLRPVDSWSGIERAIEEHKEQVKCLVLINCGATKSMLDLNLPTDVKVFILDCHRPVNLDNIYDEQVRVLAHPSEVQQWEVPEVAAIYEEQSDNDDADDEEEEGDLHSITRGDSAGGGALEDEQEDEEEEHGEPAMAHTSTVSDTGVSGRRDIVSGVRERAAQKQKKANWKRTRQNLLWNYYMHAWYSGASSILAMELVHELGKSNAQMMWAAAVGLSSQLMDQLISVEEYSKIVLDRMRLFIRKFSPRGDPDDQPRDGQLRISFDRELMLPLYSHWTIYNSMCNDPHFVCQSKMWTQKGEQNLKHILALLGLPLAECKQNYSVMRVERRKEVFEILHKHTNSTFGSFSSHFGYSANFNAADFARVLALQLESQALQQRGTTTIPDRFNSATTLLKNFVELGGRATSTLDVALERYKVALLDIRSLVFTAISQGHILYTSRYYIVYVHKSPNVIYLLSSRHCLNMYAYGLLRAYGCNARRTSKPFIVAVPMCEEQVEWYLVIGLMPLREIISDVKRKNMLGRIFETIIEDLGMEVQRESFDSNIIWIRASDRVKFFNSLEAKMEIA